MAALARTDGGAMPAKFASVRSAGFRELLLTASSD